MGTYGKRNVLNQSQQEFLRDAMHELGLTRTEFAKRIGAPWDTYRRWLLPVESEGAREMPPVAWALVREVLEHERLKGTREQLKENIGKHA